MDGMGFTEQEWEKTWESETATGTVYRPDGDEDRIWQALEMQLGNVVAALEAEYAELKAALAEARGG